MTLQITLESTGLDDQNRARRLPPDLLRRTNAKLDENDSLQAEVARLKAEVRRLTPDDAYARQCRTADIEALVLRALDNDTLRVDVMDASWCKRTGKVRDHLIEFKDRYKILKPPTRDSIRKVLVKLGLVKIISGSDHNVK